MMRDVMAEVEALLAEDDADPVELHGELESSRDELRRCWDDNEIPREPLVDRIIREYDRACADLEGLYPAVAAVVHARAAARVRQLKDAEVKAMRAYLDTVETVLTQQLRDLLGKDVEALESKRLAGSDAELPEGIDRQRAFRLRGYVLQISEALNWSEAKLTEILDSAEKAAKVAANFKDVWAKLEPQVKALWDFLTNYMK